MTLNLENKNIVIFGSGRNSLVISSILEDQNYNIIGFIDKYKNKGERIDNNLILGDETEICDIVNNYKIIGGIVGIGSNYIREKVVVEIEKLVPNFNWINCIDKHANIQKNVSIGKGVIIIGCSSVNYGSIVGNHVLINTNCSIDHDNFLENFSSTGPGVNTGGNVKIGNKSHLGIGSTIKHQIAIGRNCVIGANSFVNKNIENNILGYGSPFKEIRVRNSKDPYL